MLCQEEMEPARVASAQCREEVLDFAPERMGLSPVSAEWDYQDVLPDEVLVAAMAVALQLARLPLKHKENCFRNIETGCKTESPALINN